MLGRYLIRSNSMLYSTVNGSLEELSETNVTADIFRTYGSDLLPSSDVLLSLPNPELLCWKQEDELPTLQVKMTATPKDNKQNVITDAIDLKHLSIAGIKSVTITCEGNPLFAVSFDDKECWHAWNGTDWAQIFDEFSGMTKELFESIPTAQWVQLYTDANKFYIRVSLLDTESKLTDICVNFINY